jgi:hypothetical protein
MTDRSDREPPRATPGAGSTGPEPGAPDGPEDDPIVSTGPQRGQATGASGGYGTGSGTGSSGGSGEATDDSSAPGTDVKTAWLRAETGPERPAESDER